MATTYVVRDVQHFHPQQPALHEFHVPDRKKEVFQIDLLPSVVYFIVAHLGVPPPQLVGYFPDNGRFCGGDHGGTNEVSFVE